MSDTDIKQRVKFQAKLMGVTIEKVRNKKHTRIILYAPGGYMFSHPDMPYEFKTSSLTCYSWKEAWEFLQRMDESDIPF